jgi:hypothetical protein
MFVNELAMRTRLVNENWVRAYVMECTEVNSRRAALDIFVRAIVTTLLRRPNEQTLLQHWTGAWNAQSSECEALIREAINQRRSREVRKSDLPMPMKLQGQHRQLEDVENVGVSATGVGIILSSLVQLIEVSPRYTQGNDLYYFVRELSNVGGGNAHSPSNYSSEAEAAVGKLLRDAMTEAQFIPRLMCLIIDEDILKHVFPGASASADVVEAISRNETQPASTNIMQMNSQMNSSHHNNTEQDNKAASATMLLEAIGCILGMLYVQRFPVSYETGDVHRGRSTRALTPRAVEALTTIFEESKPQNSSGLTVRDVQRYLQRCSHNVPPQRIEQIFQRHGVDVVELANTEEGQQQQTTNRLLDLRGFLAHYLDAVQNSEFQVQQEIYAFGFRPNLTRRHHNSRWYHINNENGTTSQRLYNTREGIAIDVYMNRASLSRIGFFTELGLQHNGFYNIAANASKHVGEHLLAAYVCEGGGHDTRRFLMHALENLHSHIHNWAGSGGSDGYAMTMNVSVMTTQLS